MLLALCSNARSRRNTLNVTWLWHVCPTTKPLRNQVLEAVQYPKCDPNEVSMLTFTNCVGGPMAIPVEFRQKVRFAEFELDLRTAELEVNGQKSVLQGQPFQILLLLLEREGQLVNREELKTRLWPSDTFVDFERGLNKAVNRLRQALGDDADVPRFIETLPRKGYRFVALPVNWMSAAEKSLASPDIGNRQPHRSIAILPFAELSGRKEDEYFCDGLSEDIINLLARTSGLKVTARTSAFAFRGKSQDIRAIAKILGVRSVLEGSVRRYGTRVRVTAQLIDAVDGYHLWSERYDRELVDIFSVQDEISRAIAGALQSELAPVHRHRPNLPAYESFLKGRHHLYLATPEAMDRARQCFEEAIALDPLYPEPYCELSNYYAFLCVSGLVPTRDLAPLVRDCAIKALELDPAASMPHALLGFLAASHDYDWSEARREFALALAADYVPPEGRFWYAFCFLVPFGDRHDAIAQMEAALEPDPINPFLRVNLAAICFCAGLSERSLREVTKSLEIAEALWMCHFGIGSIALESRRYQDAIAAFLRGQEVAPWNAQIMGHLAGLFVLVGDKARASATLERLAEVPPHSYPIGMLAYHCICMNTDAAVSCFEKAVEYRDPLVLIYVRNPLTKALPKSPAWNRVLHLMNLSATDHGRALAG
jgi:TolB-like protein